jgi:hypothetical protein
LKRCVKYRRHCETGRHCEEVRRSNPLIIFLFLVLLSHAAIAAVITVKQDGSGNFTTTQAGINAASAGDTVLVWPGTYFENIDYLSKNITVASLFFITGIYNYINTTIIDGASNGSCVYISDITGSNATFCGFTLQHGSGSVGLQAGGGVFVENSNLLIRNCIIRNCISLIGGGIVCQNSNVILSASTIKNNTAIYHTGGIVIANSSEFTFDSINKNSIYLNYGPMGCDISRTGSLDEQKIILDTATVLSPDNNFFYSHDAYGNPLNNLIWEIDHGKVEQIESDLYVSEINGNNGNSGLTPSDPLKTISFALCKIVSDSINPKSIYIDQGIYSPESDEIFPICQRNNVSLIGASAESTIIDAGLLFPLYYSKVGTKNFTLNNITFKRGNDNNLYTVGVIGGLVMVDNKNVLFINNYISDSKGYTCSALMANKTEMKMSNCKIFNNAGGFPLVFANVKETPKEIIMTNSKVYNNGPGVSGRGSAVQYLGTYSYPNSTKGKFINVLINQNIFTDENGTSFGVSGITCTHNAHLDLINTTLANNIVTNTIPSGQVYATEGAEINFYNSIVYGTEDYEIFLGDGTPTSDIATVNISNTDVKGGAENIQNWNNIHELHWLDGNIDENPLWTGLGDDPYSLQADSPCIDSGVPMYEEGMDYPYIKEENSKFILYMLDGDTVTLPATDLAGNPRISGGRIDMGAYEWQDTSTSINSLLQSSVSELSVSPNPFTSNLFISFKTTHEQFITIKVLNLQGQLINSITKNNYPAGSYRLVWDGHYDSGFPLHSGTCLICLYSGGTLQSVIKANKINPR